MIIKKITSANVKKVPKKTTRFLGIIVLASLLSIMGSIACQKTEEGAVPGEETSFAVEEGLIPFEGTIKVVQGKYLYIPEAQGFDIIVQGSLDQGDLSTLVDREVRGEGEFSPDRPSILEAASIELKDESGAWSPVYTKTEEAVLDDYFALQIREDYQTLPELAYNNNESWEGKEAAKIYGTLEETDGAYKIVVYNDSDREIGKIIVDDITDFALYYVKKLGLFERFWFYVNVKDTVEWAVRRNSRDLFHADVLFAGLF